MENNSNRCSKCGGFLIQDGNFGLRCFNCGARYYKQDELVERKTIICKKCGKEVVVASKNQRLCSICVKKKYRKVKVCIVCGKEFIAKSSKTKKCINCRKANRNEEYIRKNKILSMNLRKYREAQAYANITK